VTGGVGAVTVNTDPQQQGSNRSFTEGQFQLGGGLGWRLGTTTALRVELRDFVFTGWDRDRLNVVSTDPNACGGPCPNTTFLAANGNPPEKKSTVHNLRLAIGFSYVPQGTAGGGTVNNTNTPQE
jgi:hypothetical protein